MESSEAIGMFQSYSDGLIFSVKQHTGLKVKISNPVYIFFGIPNTLLGELSQ